MGCSRLLIDIWLSSRIVKPVLAGASLDRQMRPAEPGEEPGLPALVEYFLTADLGLAPAAQPWVKALWEGMSECRWSHIIIVPLPTRLDGWGAPPFWRPSGAAFLPALGASVRDPDLCRYYPGGAQTPPGLAALLNPEDQSPGFFLMLRASAQTSISPQHHTPRERKSS